MVRMCHRVFNLALLMLNVVCRCLCDSVFPVNFGLPVCAFFQSSNATLMIPSPSKNTQSNRVHFWMFFISTITFLLSTVIEATQLASDGISNYSILVGYQDLPLMERPSLVDEKMRKINIILAWTSEFLVRLLILRNFSSMTPHSCMNP